MEKQITTSEMLEKALEYLKMGYSVIPIQGGVKHPYSCWKDYQTRIATEEEVRGWFKEWPSMNIGIVTGTISKLAIVDVDKGGSTEGLPITRRVKTGNGGWHYYYFTKDVIKSTVGIKPHIDIRAEGALVVVPPSITDYKDEKTGEQRGGKYEYMDEGNDMAPFPKEFFNLAIAEKEKNKWTDLINHPFEDHTRNNSLTSIIGGLIYYQPVDNWKSICWPIVQTQNQFQKYPLSEKELRDTFNSIAKAERQRRNTSGQVKDIVSETKDDEIEIKITLEKCIIHFKVKNIISNLLEAEAVTWIEKTIGLSDEITFRLKLHSDTNREQWSRILSKAFDHKEDKELYPWTIIVAKVARLLESEIKNKKQDWLTSEFEAKQASWILEPFIQEDQINTIFGMGSSGKTLLSLYFAKMIADKGLKTLFVDYEDTKGGWKDKLVKISVYEGMNANLENFIYFDSEQIPVADQVDKIKEIVKKYGINLVVVDSASLATGDSTSDEKSAVRLVSGLKLLRATILLIAHQRKNDGERTPIGSIQYENQSRNVWNIKSEPDASDQAILHLACTHTKANNTFLRREPIGYRIEYGQNEIKVVTESAKAYFADKMPIKDRIEQILQEGGKTSQEIANEIGMKNETIKVHLSNGKNHHLFINKEGKWFIAAS